VDWTLRVFDHVDLNTTDYTASARFYETVLSPLGMPKIAEHEHGTCFTNLNVVDRRPPTSNLHLCFYARSKLTPSTAPESKPAIGQMARRIPRLRPRLLRGLLA
jgi:catechol 2,3-dioxygenase-like lactoylglutathione lyase family enzyme